MNNLENRNKATFMS